LAEGCRFGEFAGEVEDGGDALGVEVAGVAGVKAAADPDLIGEAVPAAGATGVVDERKALAQEKGPEEEPGGPGEAAVLFEIDARANVCVV
jgi:hypothetical protein